MPEKGSDMYNPATDEASLDRCVRRLLEIIQEFPPIGEFLEAAEPVETGPGWEKRLAAHLSRVRIPGFCANRLAVEAWTLTELIAVRVITLRSIYSDAGNQEKVRKLDGIEAETEAFAPLLHATMASLEPFSSLDGKSQWEAMLKRYKNKTR
ncbi:MAG: hypothetical protein HY236_07250 [Acidobacteria bacterium]|nr:hypothetical protein [Acidobacteriota bacterium]